MSNHKHSQEWLDKTVKKWQKRLGLLNWRVRAFWEPSLEAQGRVYWEHKLWDATILIKPRVFLEERDPVEKTIIHELVHLHYAPLGDPAPDWVESAVESLTWAIYNGSSQKTR